jgi:hypothetical protein
MLIISHRGNLSGPENNLENRISYIENAISFGFDVEIDFWLVNNKMYLGHDEPKYQIDELWLKNNINSIWIHCKNINSIIYFNSKKEYNYFWHQNDNIVLTSKKFLWVHPGKQPINNSIAVLPEQYNDDIKKCIGICSDFIIKYNL